MPGSIFAHGDQADHLWKSLTCANTTDAGAATLTVLATWNWDGCTAMTITSTTTPTPTRILATVFMRAPRRRDGRGRAARGGSPDARDSDSSPPPCPRGGWPP